MLNRRRRHKFMSVVEPLIYMVVGALAGLLVALIFLAFANSGS